MAQNTVPFHTIEFQVAEVGNDRCVQLTPSEEVAALIVD
jgi:hypothetical protein